MPPSILTVTLNPALDVTSTTERLIPQQKLRCSVPRSSRTRNTVA